MVPARGKPADREEAPVINNLGWSVRSGLCIRHMPPMQHARNILCPLNRGMMLMLGLGSSRLQYLHWMTMVHVPDPNPKPFHPKIFPRASQALSSHRGTVRPSPTVPCRTRQSPMKARMEQGSARVVERGKEGRERGSRCPMDSGSSRGDGVVHPSVPPRPVRGKGSLYGLGRVAGE